MLMLWYEDKRQHAWNEGWLNNSSSVAGTSAARAENRRAAFISHFVTFLCFSVACLLFKRIYVLNDLDVLVCICVCVSCELLWDALNNSPSLRGGSILYWAAPLPHCKPRFGPSPGLDSMGKASAEWGSTGEGYMWVSLPTCCMEWAITSGELFLYTLQMCMCPKTDRSIQIPGFTNHKTHSKCTEGESFAEVNISLPLFSVHPWCAEVGHTVTWRVCPCPGCPRGCWQHCHVPSPLQHYFLMPLSWSLRKMKCWFRLKGQCYLIWKITPAIITLFLSLWWQKKWQKLEQKEIGWHK